MTCGDYSPYHDVNSVSASIDSRVSILLPFIAMVIVFKTSKSLPTNIQKESLTYFYSFISFHLIMSPATIVPVPYGCCEHKSMKSRPVPYHHLHSLFLSCSNTNKLYSNCSKAQASLFSLSKGRRWITNYFWLTFIPNFYLLLFFFC